MVQEPPIEEKDSVAEILGRAFDASSEVSPAVAELILCARFPDADVKRVAELLEKKRGQRLTPAESSLLRDYLQADSLLTLLQSKARRTLKKALVR